MDNSFIWEKSNIFVILIAWQVMRSLFDILNFAKAQKIYNWNKYRKKDEPIFNDFSNTVAIRGL